MQSDIGYWVCLISARLLSFAFERVTMTVTTAKWIIQNRLKRQIEGNYLGVEFLGTAPKFWKRTKVNSSLSCIKIFLVLFRQKACCTKLLFCLLNLLLFLTFSLPSSLLNSLFAVWLSEILGKGDYLLLKRFLPVLRSFNSTE